MGSGPLRLAAVLVLAGAVVTGCGDDASSLPAGATTTTTTSTLEAREAGADGDASSDADGLPEPEGADLDPGPLVDLAWIDDPSNPHVLVDARDSAGYVAGHIEGAVHVSASSLNDPSAPFSYQLGSAELVATALGAGGIGPDTTVVLYDDAGSLYASRVYFALHYYGHERIRILDGGVTTWELDGRPLSTTPSVVEAVDYPPGEATVGQRLVLDDVTRLLNDDETVFADARSAQEYSGDLVVGTEKGGHIPGARNLEYNVSIGPDDRFLDVETLRDLHRAAGLGAEADVVTYCLVGARGAHSWFVMSELLGYPNVALYDGSWTEYGTTDGVAIER